MPHGPDPAALELEVQENAQAEALRGASTQPLQRQILCFCSSEPVGESQAVTLAVSGPAMNLPNRFSS